MAKPKIRITLVDQKGTCGCHRGHKIGDSFDFDTERGKLCPMAMHVHFLTLIFCVMVGSCQLRKMVQHYFAVQMWM